MPDRFLLDYRKVAQVYAGGMLGPQSLNHPEGICVDPRDGSLWCGGEGGELYRISPDGTEVRQVGCTGGFILGVATDGAGLFYLCDARNQCVFVLDDSGCEVRRLEASEGDLRMVLPNYSLRSPDGKFLYVSDTRPEGGPGIWRFDLASGKGDLWMRETCHSANGLALDPGRSCLYLVESHLPGVTRIPIRKDGSAGPKEPFLCLPGNEPDGLAFNSSGELFISVYNPSRIFRCDPRTRSLDLVVEDSSTDILHHCTNIAFRGDSELFCANLGAWHISRIDLSSLYLHE